MDDTRIVEAVLFASDAPLLASEIARADERLDEDRVEAALAALRAEYDRSDRAFEVRHVADGVQIMTRPEFAPFLERLDTVPVSPRLSGPALEALAIVAYRQPIGRIDVEYVRGVNSTGVIRTLIDRGLITAVGRGEGIGRPVLYGTTSRFLQHFGLPSIEDLPRPDELPVVLRDRVPLEDVGDASADLEGDGDSADEPAPIDLESAVEAVLAQADLVPEPAE
ncbi:MAG: SMC-Scp complex subunit ScpB [Gemmatimonadetes bacterium]|nr:SMC-Scp complex subunit ScpB [Gemmatimonadota bacterium]MCY3944199.1 SMC-Scp complex subunit ScpB [Gemmatimonadota bacterium]